MPAEPAPTPAPVPTAPAASAPYWPPEKVLPLLGDEMRWRIVKALLQRSPLSTAELGPALGRRVNLVSKHMHVLRRAGLVVPVKAQVADRRRQCFALVDTFRVPGQPMWLDFGCCLLRFDG